MRLSAASAALGVLLYATALVRCTSFSGSDAPASNNQGDAAAGDASATAPTDSRSAKSKTGPLEINVVLGVDYASKGTGVVQADSVAITLE
jgi:hypothetical protein